MGIPRRKRGQGVDPGQLQGQAHGLQLRALYHGDAPGSQRSVKFRQPLRGQPLVVPRPPCERGGVWSVYLHPVPVATTPEADGAKIVVTRIYGFTWNRCLSPRAFVNSAVVESIIVIEGVTEVPAAPGTTSNSGFNVSG
jgi:hypothetical protein